MKTILIAFHLVMVLLYLVMGGILFFTAWLPVLKGAPRILLGILLMIYAGYRGFTVYRNFIQRKNDA